jgi:uroporphyrinogen-III synthase
MRVLAQPLQGVTVAIPESRYGEEFARLFERVGAQVRSCPLMTEEIVENRSSIREFIERTSESQFDIAIFMTGIGTSLIFNEADSLDQRETLVSALSTMTVVSRGSKSTAALRKANVRIDLIPQTATSEGLINMFRRIHLTGRRIAVQLYGTPNPLLTGALEQMGAEVFPVSVYTYREVSSAAEVETFIRELIDGRIQIIAFTSAPQVTTLFESARLSGLRESLIESLRERIQVASIGEVTTRALSAAGIRPHIVPAESKMGPLVQAICTTRSS